MTLETLDHDPEMFAQARGHEATALACAMQMTGQAGFAQVETHWIWFLDWDVLRAFAVPKASCSALEFRTMMKRIVSRG